MRSIPRLAQWVKDPELPLLLGWRLWPRSDLCSRSSICLGVAKKKKSKKKKKAHLNSRRLVRVHLRDEDLTLAEAGG